MSRRCSECGKSLAGRRADVKTCSPNCRVARSRRLKKQRKENLAQAHIASAYTPEQAQIAETVKASTDIVRDVVREEVTPIVREALTDDVLAGIQKLVRLTPKMIAAIEVDLTHPDDTVRQRAYTLLAKYTLGNPSVAPAPQQAQTAPMQVFFEMPRPGDESSTGDETLESTAVEIKECVECKQEKDETQFVGNSDRCQDCHERLQALVREKFGDG